MCGIVGLINGSRAFKSGVGATFRDLFWANQIRGFDGGGVFWYNEKKDEYVVVKDASFGVVLKDTEFQAALRDNEKMPFFIGHNRAATRGKVETENNHPFDEENIVLCHNGTMSYIPREYDNGTKVDSHAIAKMISKASPKAFMKDSFGAYALVWFDKNTRQLNLLRNKDRPLSLIYTRSACFIASEAKMAEWCASRNDIDVVSVEDIKEHHLYQFEPFNLTPKVTDLSEIVKPIGTYLYPTRSLYDYEDEYDVAQSWRRYRKQSGWVNETPKTVEEEIKDFMKIKPWDYFERKFPKRTQRSSDTGILKLDSHSTATIHLKVGEKLIFSLDNALQHKTFTEILGNIPKQPINQYEVRGNIAKSRKEIDENINLLSGVITQINNKHGMITVWVRDIDFTDIPDPEYAVEVEVQTEKK